MLPKIGRRKNCLLEADLQRRNIVSHDGSDSLNTDAQILVDNYVAKNRLSSRRGISGWAFLQETETRFEDSVRSWSLRRIAPVLREFINVEIGCGGGIALNAFDAFEHVREIEAIAVVG